MVLGKFASRVFIWPAVRDEGGWELEGEDTTARRRHARGEVRRGGMLLERDDFPDK